MQIFLCWAIKVLVWLNLQYSWIGFHSSSSCGQTWVLLKLPLFWLFAISCCGMVSLFLCLKQYQISLCSTKHVKSCSACILNHKCLQDIGVFWLPRGSVLQMSKPCKPKPLQMWTCTSNGHLGDLNVCYQGVILKLILLCHICVSQASVFSQLLVLQLNMVLLLTPPGVLFGEWSEKIKVCICSFHLTWWVSSFSCQLSCRLKITLHFVF